MTFYATNRRDAHRIAEAVKTMTGYEPSFFVEYDRKGHVKSYSIRENEYGSGWQQALQVLLDDGYRSDQTTKDRVAAKMEELGL